jgi:serine/threonine protein kinase
MDIAASLFEALCTPVAPFLELAEILSDEPPAGNEELLQPFMVQAPRTELNNSLWSIDGCTAGGTQLFTVPRFLSRQIPLRVDLLIPDQRHHPQCIRRMLRSASLCHAPSRTAKYHPLVQHVLEGLENWTRLKEGFWDAFGSLPFGSRLILVEITPSPQAMQFFLSPEYELERKMLSFDTLKASWKTSDLLQPYPPTMDLTELEVERHVQDSITFVRITREPEQGILVFKSSNSGVHYLYNELRTLLTIPGHRNIIIRPKYIVTKRCCFGSKIGVCGFLLPYYPIGSLRDSIPRLRLGEEGMSTVSRLAVQICNGLLHLQETADIYHSDLRPDNILLSQMNDSNSLDAILIDFEQRGNWYTWSPPEVTYLQYLQDLLQSDSVPEANKTDCIALLQSVNCEIGPISEAHRYKNCVGGCNEAWNCLSARQRESAAVYLFGKLIWCLFEGVSTVSAFDNIWHSGPDDGAIEFPEFTVRTPVQIRELVLECTNGAPEHEGTSFSAVVREGDKMILRSRPEGSVTKTSSAQEILEASKAWWKTELKRARSFLEKSSRLQEGRLEEFWIGPCYTRPTLREVLGRLESYRW